MNEIVPLQEQERAFVGSVISQLGLKYGIDLVVDRVRSQIHCAQGQSVTNGDVAMVLTEALAKHLDPLKGTVYAFKGKDGNLVIGTTKRGFQIALASQPTFRNLTFKVPEIKTKNFIDAKGRRFERSYDDYSTCVISKRFSDGTEAIIEGTAYLDEEFNPSSAAWCKSPKRMLDTRALCIASANAYGWGAYEPEEAGNVTGFHVNTEAESGDVMTVQAETIEDAQPVQSTASSGASRAQLAIAKANTLTKEMLMEQMKNAKTHDEVRTVFSRAPEALRKDQDVINLGKAITQALEVSENAIR